MRKQNPFLKFVPDWDKEAEEFLKAYEFEESITTPMPVPIQEIAKRMSLTVIQTECLSFDDSVQGAIAFSDGIIEVFDWNARELVGYEAHTGDVFIDATICSPGRVRNTLAHECYHWYKHRHYFIYNRAHNHGQEFAFRCDKSVAKAQQIPSIHSDMETMEMQARMMAPRILMPKKASQKLLEDLIVRSQGFQNRREATELMITEFANTFEVSKQSAAIRMLDLGFTDAEPFCTYDIAESDFDDRNKLKSQAKVHRSPIDPVTAFEIYENDEMLRETLKTGAFCFADGYFVINQSEYVFENSNHQLCLTEYARSHLAECTLDFVTKLVSSSLQHSARTLMLRTDVEYKRKTSLEANTQNTELFNAAKDFEKRFKRSKDTHISANEWLWRRMQEEHWNTTTFQEKTGLDAMNYTRVQKPEHKFQLKALVAMGVGLSLTANEMVEVLSLAGLSFNPTSREEIAYLYLFSAFYGKGIDECNLFLKKIGVNELGTQQRT